MNLMNIETKLWIGAIWEKSYINFVEASYISVKVTETDQVLAWKEKKTWILETKYNLCYFRQNIIYVILDMYVIITRCD